MRREQILRAAMDEIAEQGYAHATMSRIAKRAGASKETLYSWFGDKPGLASALIAANANRALSVPSPENIDSAYTIEQARGALLKCAEGLLDLLTSRESVALNRAAMESQALAHELLAAGRGRTGSAVEQYLARLHELGILHAPDIRDAFRLLYGLTIQDAQIQALLGAPPLTTTEKRRRAEQAVDHFLALTSTS